LKRSAAAPEIADVVARLRHIGSARMRGSLYDLGHYPGAVKDSRRSTVVGEVYELPPDPHVLREIDRYEGFNPARPAKSLFRRQKRAVTLGDGKRIYCWVYLYNRPLRRAIPIDSGRYKKSRRAAPG
jgi:gamma-glutamylcyclotransferase (GGCT)/AIG2-like uncharacterized protein YtfP